jgi:hypothetical protein
VPIEAAIFLSSPRGTIAPSLKIDFGRPLHTWGGLFSFTGRAPASFL